MSGYPLLVAILRRSTEPSRMSTATPAWIKGSPGCIALSDIAVGVFNGCRRLAQLPMRMGVSGDDSGLILGDSETSPDDAKPSIFDDGGRAGDLWARTRRTTRVMSCTDGFHPDLQNPNNGDARQSLHTRVHHVKASEVSADTAQADLDG